MFNDEEIELTPEERAAFAALPRETPSSDILEERVVRALRSRGFFTPEHARSSRVARIALRAAAAVLLFGAGALTERFVSERGRVEPAAKPAQASQVKIEGARPEQMEQWI